MSSQLAILQNNNREALNPFRFWLQNASQGNLELETAPDGWEKSEIEYKRSETYHGVSRSVSVKELTFYKKARNFIRDVYESQGIDGEITFTVKYLDTDYTYTTYHTGKIDLQTYEIDELGVKVSVTDASFNSKVYTRDDIEVNLLSTTAIDGQTVSDWSVQSVKMPDTSISRSGSLVDDIGTFITTTPHLVPLGVSGSPDFTELEDQPAGGSVTDGNNGFFVDNQEDRVLRVNGTIGASFTDVNSHTLGIVLRVFEANASTYTDIGLVSPVADTSGSWNLSVDYTFDLLLGQYAMIYGEIDPLTGLTNFNYDTISLTVSENYDGTPEKTAVGFQYYEAFLRNCQLMTGNDNPFYSEYFGRTDSALTTYGSDGQVGFLVRGIYFRLAYVSSYSERYPISVKFKELFQSLSAIYNLGMSIEQVSGVDKVRIEERSHFYNNTVAVDISDRIRTEAIGKAVDPTMFYKEINVGYSKYEYDQVGGLFEYNTKSNYATPSLVDSKLDIVSKVRADNQGMRLLLKAPSETDYESSKDYKGDDDNFFVDALDVTGTYTARTDQGFTTVGGTIYADLSFNLLLSPARMIRRWGANIKAGFIHALSSFIQWQTSDKNTGLFTRLTTETSDVYENADIQVNDLDTNIWYNEILKVKAYLKPAEKVALDANLNGLIKLDTDLYGWIKSVKSTNENGKAEFELIRSVYTDSEVI